MSYLVVAVEGEGKWIANLHNFNLISKETGGLKPHKMVKHTQTIRCQEPANCLNVFNHFVGLALPQLLQNLVLSLKLLKWTEK